MLTNQLYNWQRFWLPREGNMRLDDFGYLADPEGPLGTAVNPQLIRSEAFADIPCLVLLGEPGMGKSTVMQAHAEEVKATVEASTDSYLFC